MMRYHPTVDIPPYTQSPPDPTPTNPSSPYNIHEALKALQHYLPSNSPDTEPDNPYACDNFRMYEFKVRRCMRVRSHDWTDCPYAHPGEKARRRDPRKYSYSGTACPDFRKGCCTKGDACEFAHGVFECWLHPSRYRTQACKDGVNCTRRVCFFAHSVDQLRVLSTSPDSLSFEPSPPESPTLCRSFGSVSEEVLGSLRSLELGGGSGKWVNNSWGSPVYGSPASMSRGGVFSLPGTPTRCVSGGFDGGWEEEPVMERVESGRDLRMKMFERISKGSCLERSEPDPDVDWVSDLLK